MTKAPEAGRAGRTGPRRAEIISTVVVLLLLGAGVFALWPRPAQPTAGTGAAPSTTTADLGPLRATGFPSCPTPSGAPPAAPLAGVVIPCLGSPGSVDLGAALAGRPALVNFWASWCAPCRAELPAIAEYASRPGAVTVLGIDVRDDPANALRLLAELGVRLPTAHDPDQAAAAAFDLPPPLPISYVVRADGSVARVDPPVPFSSADDVAAAVERYR